MELVRNSETEWLELKASFYPESGNFEQGTNADDYRWNVAKAVIALANSIGGVVLLGLPTMAALSVSRPAIHTVGGDPRGRRRFVARWSCSRFYARPRVGGLAAKVISDL